MSDPTDPKPADSKPASADKSGGPVPPAKVKVRPAGSAGRESDEIKTEKAGLAKKIGLVMLTLLAFAMIFPSTLGPRGLFSGSGQGQAVGKLAGRDVLPGEIDAARESWSILSGIAVEFVGDRNQPGSAMLSDYLAARYGLDVRQFVTEHPNDGFWMLLQAARQVVPGVSREAVESAYAGKFDTIDDYTRPFLITKIFFPQPGGGQIQLREDDPNRERILLALRDFLLLTYLAKHENELPQPSAALVQNVYARLNYQVKATSVAFPAKDYLARVPTTAPAGELEAHLAKYADVPSGAGPSPASPLGFGYRRQERVKLQTLTVKFEDVRTAVRAQRVKDQSRYWDLAAQRYYRDHPQQFRTATTAPTSGPSATQPASSQPAMTLPAFEAVREKAIELAIDEEARRRLDGPRQPSDTSAPIMERIGQIVRDDYKAWVAAGSKPDAAYLSADYLGKVAQQVQAQYGVLPTVDANARDERDAADLSSDPALGRFARFKGDLMKSEPLGRYVIEFSRSFVRPEQLTRLGDQVLDVGEPSDVLVSMSADRNPWPSGDFTAMPVGDRLIARVTEALPARPATAADMAASDKLQAKVQEDWRTARAMELARADADAVCNAARTRGSLDGASEGRPVSPITIRLLGSSLAAKDDVTGWAPDAARKLLAEGADPFVVLDNPQSQTVYALHRDVVTSGLIDTSYSDAEQRQAVEQQVRMQLAMGALGAIFPEVPASPPLQQSLLNADALRTRIDYKPLGKD